MLPMKNGNLLFSNFILNHFAFLFKYTLCIYVLRAHHDVWYFQSQFCTKTKMNSVHNFTQIHNTLNQIKLQIRFATKKKLNFEELI